MSSRQRNSLTRELKVQAAVLGSFVATFWIVETVNRFLFSGGLIQFGIVPHRAIGLRGILFAPFLHGGFGHALANTVPFAILGWLVMVQETSDFAIVTLTAAAVGGLGVWLFGTPGSVHVGASTLIFGYLGFLLLRGYFQRNWASIILSLLVAWLYGGLVWGLLPSQPGISWQGHLFGFLGGALAARAIAAEKRYYR